jgi:hypothetical protein
VKRRVIKVRWVTELGEEEIMNMKKKIREKKRIYVVLLMLMLMLLSGSTSLVLGQPIVVGNRVEIISGTASRPVENVYGGEVRERYSHTERVEGNTVILSSMRVGEVYGGDVWGSGTALANRVVLHGLENVIEVYGGWVGYDSVRDSAGVEGRVEGNEVIATDTVVVFRPYTHWTHVGKTDGDVYGGKLRGRGIAAKNKVILRNVTSEHHGDVGGGCVRSGAAIKNRVEINKGRILRGDIYGGYVGEGIAQQNRVTLNDVIVGSKCNGGFVYGGICGAGEATGNRVTLIEVKAERDVYGGYVDAIGGKATGNEVNIEDYTVIYGTLYGGCIAGKHFRERSDIDHIRLTMTNANGDTFEVSPSPDQIEEEGRGFRVRIGDAVTGNRLNLRRCLLEVETIRNFERINFHINEETFLRERADRYPCLRARQGIDLRGVDTEVEMTITDPSKVTDLVGKEKVLMSSDRKIRNYSPSNVRCRVIGNGDRGLIPQLEVGLNIWRKMLVLKIKALVLQEQAPHDSCNVC